MPFPKEVEIGGPPRIAEYFSTSFNKKRFMTQPFDIFVINLERATQRHEFMREQLDRLGVEYTFVSAMDARVLDPALADVWIDDARTAAFLGKPLTPGEKGCALSHILLWEKISRGETDALILEDDTILPEHSLVELLAPVLPELKSDRVILLRHVANSFWRKGTISLLGAAYTLCKPNHKVYMAAAYLITPQAARQLVTFLRRHKLTHPVDLWYRPDSRGFTKVVDTWAVSPELIPTDYTLESNIEAAGGDRDRVANLSKIGWIKRRFIQRLRQALFPAMSFVRSIYLKPIWPDSSSIL